MFSFINGKLAEVGDEYIVVSAGGIGFLIYVPQTLKSELPMLDEEVFIYTYFKVGEDFMNLYGFGKKKDLDIFKKLLDVNGVGPKAALSILSVFTTEELISAIINDDDKLIAKANGIGQKTAKRLILELKDKIDLTDIELSPKNEVNKYIQDAVEGLVALGYSRTQAFNVIGSLKIDEDMNADTILKMAIRKL